MPKKYSKVYHVVWSPKDKNRIEDMRDIVVKYLEKECSEYIVCDEYGESGSNHHLDMIIWLLKERRDDKVRESFQRVCDDFGKYSVKAYAVEEDRLKWQIGYCLKEGNMYISKTSNEFDFKECKEIYFKSENKYKGKKDEKSWNIDGLVENYVNYLLENDKPHNSDNWRDFKRINRDKIKYSVLCKVKLEVLMEYCEMYEIYEYRNLL